MSGDWLKESLHSQRGNKITSSDTESSYTKQTSKKRERKKNPFLDETMRPTTHKESGVGSHSGLLLEASGWHENVILQHFASCDNLRVTRCYGSELSSVVWTATFEQNRKFLYTAKNNFVWYYVLANKGV